MQISTLVHTQNRHGNTESTLPNPQGLTQRDSPNTAHMLANAADRSVRASEEMH